MIGILDPTRPGLLWPVTIDGIRFTASRQPISEDFDPLEVDVDLLDAGSQTYGYFPGEGHADTLDRLRLVLGWTDFGKYGADMYALKKLRAEGGYHSFTLWQPSWAKYTARAGQTLFYLPRYRKNAAQSLAGQILAGQVVGTDTLPFTCTINNGSPLTENYVADPASLPGSPATGNVYVSATAETDGEQEGYVPFVVGTVLAAGDVVRIEYCPDHMVSIKKAKNTFPGPVSEGLSYEILER